MPWLGNVFIDACLIACLTMSRPCARWPNFRGSKEQKRRQPALLKRLARLGRILTVCFTPGGQSDAFALSSRIMAGAYKRLQPTAAISFALRARIACFLVCFTGRTVECVCTIEPDDDRGGVCDCRRQSQFHQSGPACFAGRAMPVRSVRKRGHDFHHSLV